MLETLNTATAVSGCNYLFDYIDSTEVRLYFGIP